MVCIEYREGSMFYKETAVGPIINIVSRCVITHGWTGIKNIIPLKFLYFLSSIKPCKGIDSLQQTLIF